MRPRPDHASPVITSGPGPWLIGACGEGEVITDLASITQVHLRAEPSAMVSVYFEVSSRLSTAVFRTSMRRSHLTHMLPSQPGTTSRTG